MKVGGATPIELGEHMPLSGSNTASASSLNTETDLVRADGPLLFEYAD